MMVDEFEPGPQSLVTWGLMELGLPYFCLLALAGFASVVASLMIVIRGKGPMAAVTLLLIVPVPLLIGFFGAMHGAISGFGVLGMSNTPLKASEVAPFLSAILVRPVVGMLAMVPGFTIAFLGAFFRSFPSVSNFTADT